MLSVREEAVDKAQWKKVLVRVVNIAKTHTGIQFRGRLGAQIAQSLS
jgi:hypothetical protein